MCSGILSPCARWRPAYRAEGTEPHAILPHSIRACAHEGRSEYPPDEPRAFRRPRRVRLSLVAQSRDAYLRRALYRHPARLLGVDRGDATGAAARQTRHRHPARLHRHPRDTWRGDRAPRPPDRGRDPHAAGQPAVVSEQCGRIARPLAATERRAVARQYALRQSGRAVEWRGGQGGARACWLPVRRSSRSCSSS